MEPNKKNLRNNTTNEYFYQNPDSVVKVEEKDIVGPGKKENKFMETHDYEPYVYDKKDLNIGGSPRINKWLHAAVMMLVSAAFTWLVMTLFVR